MTEPLASAPAAPAGARPGRGGKDDDKGLGTHVNELLGLIIAYTKQETVEPIKLLGRYVLWGVLGAIFVAAGGALAVLAVVRLLQYETGPHLHGDLTWVPYMGGVLLAGAGAVVAVASLFRSAR